MKTQSLLTSILAAVSLPLAAQTAPPVHHTATTATHSTVPGCAKLPELSPKIPALPPGTPCAKPLFRFTTNPQVRLDYASPLVPLEFREALGLIPATFELDYADTKVGNGELARAGMDYTLQYTGYLADGTQFDTSVGKSAPFTFPIGQHKVIPGWDLGFQGMRIGGKRRLFIPYQMGYGEQGHGTIPGHAELIFDIELLSQKPTEAPQPPPGPGQPGAQGGRPMPPPQGAPRPATPPPAGTTPPPATTTPPPAGATPPASAAPPPAAAKPATPPPAANPKPASTTPPSGK